MTSIANFDFINTKIRARRARLYEGDRLEALLAARDLPDLVRLLGMESAGFTHYRVEAGLVARHLEELKMVALYLGGSRRRFFDALLNHYYKENLKVIARLKGREAPAGDAARMVVRLEGWNVDELLEASTVADVLLAVKDEHIRRWALKGLGDYEKSGTTFFVELGIDAGFFIAVFDAAAHLRPADREAVKTLVCREAGAHDVLAVMRSRFNYGIEFERIKPFLSGYPAKLDLARLAEAASFEGALRLVPAALLPAKAARDVADIPGLEFAMWSRIFRSARELFRTSLFDLGAIVAYYYLKRLELANLISVVEGVRLGMAKAEIRENLLPTGGF